MILLAFLLLQETGSAPAPTTQLPPSTSIRVGDRVEGVLPVRLEGGRNTSEVIFEFDQQSLVTVTLTLESLDFDASLSIRDPATGAEARDRNSWRHSNSWLVHEGKSPSKLAVRVAAEDDRGGEFVLLVQAGRMAPPRGAAAMEEVIAYCEAVAVRALERMDVARGAKYLGTASEAAYKFRDFARAKELAERQLEQARAAGLAGEQLRAQANLGGAERALGHRDRARDLLQESLAGIEQRAGAQVDPSGLPQLAALAVFVNDELGEIARETGGFASAIPFYRQALEWMPQANRPSFEPIGWCRLGDALSEVGEVEEARAAIEKGVRLAEGLARPSLLASALLSQARFLQRQGSPAEARAQCERALGLFPQPEIGIELEATLANACIDLAQFEQALSALDAAEARALELGLDRYEIPMRISRARIAYDLWDLPHARTLLEEALAKQEASGSPLHLVDILEMLGQVHFALGQKDDARKRYEEAIQTCEATNAREKQALVLVDLAWLQESLGDLQGATVSCEAAEELACNVGNPFVEDMARNERAYVLFLQGKYVEARELAAAVTKRREASGDLRVAAEAHDTLARIGLSLGELDATEAALRAVNGILAQGSPPLDRFAAAGSRSHYAKWGAFAQELVARRSRTAGLRESDREALIAKGWRDAGAWKGRILLEHLRERSSARTVSDPGLEAAGQPPAIPRIVKGTALLEYVDGLERLYAYVVVPGSIRLVELGERESIEARARGIVGSMAEMGTPPEAFALESEWMYQELLAPLLTGLPKGTSALVIVPTPGLAILPFEALVKPNRGEKNRAYADLHYLIDEFTISYAPSSPVLAELQGRRSRSHDRRFLILGDPVYPAESAELLLQDETLAQARPGSPTFDLGRLKRTREETLEIARLLLLKDLDATDAQRTELLQAKSDRSPSLHTALYDLHLGAGAGRAALSGDLRSYSYLHIAAHGHVDPDDPRRSGLLLSYDPDTNGLFTLEDVMDLQLDADLAVLSACDTASGPIVSGEGVQSVACSFLHAGARSVVATLWKIEDPDASEIMQSFYAAHLEKEEVHPALALHQAKLEYRHSRKPRGISPGGSGTGLTRTASNPYFWAPFVFVGAGPE